MPGRRTTTDQPTTPAAEPPAPAEGPVPGPERPEERPGDLGLPEDPAEAARALQGAVERFPLGRSNGLSAVQWDADQRDDYPLTVHEAIAEVTRRVGSIAKTGVATGSDGGYRFRGIEQVLEELHPILGDVGLVILPAEVRDARFDTRATKSGGTLNVARLLVRYRLIGPDGSETSGEAWGEAGDSGDKATQKAHSQSYKSFTLQTFSIPTEQSAADEPDAVNEAARPFTADEVSRALSAAQAADGAASIEALAGVRRRALALLDVPVTLEDGSVMPLRLLFEARLASLDRAAGEQS